MKSSWHHAQVRGWKWGWKFGRTRLGVHRNMDGHFSAGLGFATIWLLKECSRGGAA